MVGNCSNTKIYTLVRVKFIALSYFTDSNVKRTIMSSAFNIDIA